MTVLVEQYWREISWGLAQNAIPVWHFVLHADQETLRKRIEGDTVRQLQYRLFGAAGADVPLLFLQVIRRYVSATATTLANSHATPSRHSVCWLDGTLFGGLSCAEFDDAAEPIIRGAVVPVRQLRLATVSAHDVEHDPVTGEVTQWKRSTVFRSWRPQGSGVHRD
ncbi:hypothetical protein [Mycobacterium sp.]|uniref:hypothetical protein n=1 Tax=Mycobacterium sp. TaxID=1785 RepID=UPI003F97DA24